jgi:predicted nuclease of restriction endonuclease-like (RecB) superfamily
MSEIVPDNYQLFLNEKLQPLVGEISWSKHIIIMSKCKDDLEREFYIKMTKKFGWTKNVLIHQVENRAYERFLLNQTNFDQSLPEKYRPQAKLAVKDEYTFDFLELGEEHSKRELELALIKITTTLPEDLQKYLPSGEEIAKRLEGVEI